MRYPGRSRLITVVGAAVAFTIPAMLVLCPLGCRRSSQQAQAVTTPTPTPTPAPAEISVRLLRVGNPDIWIVTDNITGREYIIAACYQGIAVTPRLSKEAAK